MKIEQARARVAEVVGPELANQLQTDHLPAILHAIEEDEEAVRQCARQAARPGVQNPPLLLMYLARERKYAGQIAAPTSARTVSVPPPIGADTAERMRQAHRDWKRIAFWIQKDPTVKALYREYRELFPPPDDRASGPEREEYHRQAEVVRKDLIRVIDEMEAL